MKKYLLIIFLLFCPIAFAYEIGQVVIYGTTWGDGSGYAPSDIFLKDGNVGIGSVNPTSSLDVVGAIKATSTITASNISGSSSGTNTGDQTTVSGNAGTASALATNGGNCSGNEFALGVTAAGVGECAQPAFSNLSGSATDAQIPNDITITETDPQVGTLTNTKWCTTDGTDIDCTSNAPAGGEAFPVGSVFIATVSTNPATLLGYGTWASFGAGKVLIGLDSGDADFDTAEETGGTKTKTIAASNLPELAVTITDSGHTHLTQRYPTATGGSSGFTNDTSMSGTLADNTLPTKSGTTGITATANTAGANTALSIVQPYIVVYMWERTG